MMTTAATRRLPPPPPSARAVERRTHERYELLAQVELRKQDVVAILAVANVSQGGMLLRRTVDDVEIAKGDQVSVYLDVDATSVTLDAVVVRVGPEQVALMWTTNAPAALVQLEQLLAALAR
jgi:hypothetical protein